MKPRSPSASGQSPIEFAAQLMESGQLIEAEKSCRAILTKTPNHADALHLLGVILGNLGKPAEAVATLERAVKIAPNNVSAWTNLGILLTESEPARAERCLKRAIELAPHSVHALGNQATLYFDSARYLEAAGVLEKILEFVPDNAQAIRLLARSHRMMNDFPRVVELLHRLMHLEPNDKELPELLREAYFLWYDSVDTEHDKAIPILEQWLAFDPESPVARHMHASLTLERVPERASPEYIEHHFDAFAAQFDDVLTKLEYRGPELVREYLAGVVPTPSANLDIVDIGCGTGRLGPLVVPWKRRLVGVDLSRKMLDEASKLGVYDALEHAEITEYLGERPSSFDMVFVVDTLVYFGNLADLFGAAFRCLRPGGRFIGMVEKRAESESEPVGLHTGGRYSHKLSYLNDRLATAGFRVERTTEAPLRIEFKKPVEAVVFSALRP